MNAATAVSPSCLSLSPVNDVGYFVIAGRLRMGKTGSRTLSPQQASLPGNTYIYYVETNSSRRCKKLGIYYNNPFSAKVALEKITEIKMVQNWRFLAATTTTSYCKGVIPFPMCSKTGNKPCSTALDTRSLLSPSSFLLVAVIRRMVQH